MEEKKKDGRGGKREGAGRPKGIKRPYSSINLALPDDYIKKLRELAEKKNLSLSKLIQEMIDTSWID